MALKAFRQYNESDVINVFSYTGAGDLEAGTLVAPSVGIQLGEGVAPVEMDGTSFDSAVNLSTRAVSPRWNTTARLAANSSAPLGITLMKVQELDENGEKLVNHPRKAAEMGVVVKGQAIPVLTRGVLHVTNITGTGAVNAPIYANVAAGQEGKLTTSAGTGNVKVGVALSAVANGEAVVRFSF